MLHAILSLQGFRVFREPLDPLQHITRSIRRYWGFRCTHDALRILQFKLLVSGIIYVRKMKFLTFALVFPLCLFFLSLR